MNSKTFTVYATVTCPHAFPDWGTVEIVTCWCGYCSTQWLVLILNSNRIAMLSWMLGQDTLVSVRTVWWIRIPWGIVVAIMPVIPDVGIAETTIEEWFSDRLFPREEFFWAIWSKLFPASDGWDIWSSSEDIDSVCGTYEVVIFPKLMADVHNLVVEVIPPTFC